MCSLSKYSKYIGIQITNLWPNRLIGDKRHPDKRKTSTTWNYWKPDVELLPSGLWVPLFLRPTFVLKSPFRIRNKTHMSSRQ